MNELEDLGRLEKFLFHNIGKTLKRYAVITFVVETLAGIIAGILSAIGEESIVYLLISVCAPFVAYTLSMFLYGFGELVDSTAITAKENQNKNQVVEEDELPEL